MDEAFVWNAKGLKANPNSRELILNEANLHFFNKNYTEALVWFNKASILYPGNNGIANKITSIQKLIEQN